MQDSFTGVILAGGASRRMGTDKAKLTAQSGEPLLDIMKFLLIAAGAKKVAILGRPEEAGGIADKHAFAGPARAIIDYLARCPVGSRHLVVPIDMPNLTRNLLHALANQKSWAMYSDYNLPFLAIAGKAIPTNLKRIKDLLSFHHVSELALSPGQEQAFLNLNHPHEFTRWRHKSLPATSSINSLPEGSSHV